MSSATSSHSVEVCSGASVSLPPAVRVRPATDLLCPQERVSIFKQHHKFIIGKGGANIRKIRDETSTRIDLPDESSESSEIVITGRKEDVLAARDRIQKIQNELANIVQKDINVPSKFHNSIIGPGGRLIQSIMEECGGVQIKFPAADSNSDKVGRADG